MAKKKTTVGKLRLTSKTKSTKVENVMRDIVLKRMAELDMNPYRLAKAVRGKMTAQTVYDFVAGRSDMTSRLAGHLLEALGLEIRPKS